MSTHLLVGWYEVVGGRTRVAGDDAELLLRGDAGVTAGAHKPLLARARATAQQQVLVQHVAGRGHCRAACAARPGLG